MTTTGAELLTADELPRLDVRGELIRGVLHEMPPPGAEHAEIVANLTIRLGNFIQPRRLGRLATDMGVWLERGPDTVRAPDIAFTSAERSPLGPRITGYPEVVPDLAVEVRSPRDSRADLERKAEMWLSHGVRLVWVVHPGNRTIDVHRSGADAVTLADHASPDGLDVLPGFTCPVSAVFDS